MEPTDGPLTYEELALATRNRGMPLEALRYDVTPVGLHYLLIHFDIPALEASTWRLRVGGALEAPLELDLAELRALPKTSVTVTMECAGDGRGRLRPRPLSTPWLYEAIGTAEWTGTSLWPILELAGLRPEAMELVFTGADRGVQGGIEHDYARSLSVAETRRPEVILAYEMNGRPLEPQHGHPVRLVVPGWYGMASVKWLTTIEAVSAPFGGFQMASYRYRGGASDDGVPIRRMRPRALMVPPGMPDYFSRHRVLESGRVLLFGRAWSGEGSVVRVEVGIDGEWRDAELGAAPRGHSWRAWSYEWDATPGEHTLSCRATDSAGNSQPTDAPWNYGGFGNNSVQTVGVTVR